MHRAKTASPLYASFEGPVSTLYAELVERARSQGQLLPGTPGSLALRERPGSGSYWYRRYYPLPKLPQVEKFVCAQEDHAAHDEMSSRIESAAWGQEQVRMLRTLGMQVADKNAAAVLVEMHNRGLFAAGLVLVGTLAPLAGGRGRVRYCQFVAAHQTRKFLLRGKAYSESVGSRTP